MTYGGKSNLGWGTVGDTNALATLMGKRVRVWVNRTRGAGISYEGVVDCGHDSCFTATIDRGPHEGDVFVISTKRVLDVWNEKTKEWEPWEPPQ